MHCCAIKIDIHVDVNIRNISNYGWFLFVYEPNITYIFTRTSILHKCNVVYYYCDKTCVCAIHTFNWRFMLHQGIQLQQRHVNFFFAVSRIRNIICTHIQRKHTHTCTDVVCHSAATVRRSGPHHNNGNDSPHSAWHSAALEKGGSQWCRTANVERALALLNHCP